jgi:hypothetical protein
MNDPVDHPKAEFVERLMEENGRGYEEGDALMITGEVSISQLSEELSQSKEDLSYEVNVLEVRG